MMTPPQENRLVQAIAAPLRQPCSVRTTGSSRKIYFRTSKKSHRMDTAVADGGATEPSESLGSGPPPSSPALCHTAEASVFSVQAQGLSPPWFSDSPLLPKILWRRMSHSILRPGWRKWEGNVCSQQCCQGSLDIQDHPEKCLPGREQAGRVIFLPFSLSP